MKRCFSCFQTFDEKLAVCPYCGSIKTNEPNEPIHLAPGTVLANRYIIGKSIGSGGFGIVYKAWDSQLNVVVAIKEFYVSRLMTRAEGLKNVIVNKQSRAEYEFRKERFLAEARTMAKFNGERSITSVLEFFEENNTAYIVMELLKGKALNQYMQENGGKIDPDLAVFIAGEVGKALKALHGQNIIHRDVAPDNIFICSERDIRVKLMDLGAAKLADGTDEHIDIVLKPGYSPVEQYDNSNSIGPWTDIYALGATLYVMLTGIKPDESTDRKIEDTLVPPHELDPSIPENISNTVMKAMALEKHMRFKNVQEFLDALNGNKKVLSLAKEKRRRSFRRFTGIFAATLAVLAITAIVAGVFGVKKAEDRLEPAKITVWLSVSDENAASKTKAMEDIFEDFQAKNPGVTIRYEAIQADRYEEKLRASAEADQLPDLFESTGLSDNVLEKAVDLNEVLRSPQFKECSLLKQYSDYYPDRKRMPLAIEVPMACVIISSGEAMLDYGSSYFSSFSDFNGADLSFSSSCERLWIENMKSVGRYENALTGNSKYLSNDAFMNAKSPVLLTSTMEMGRLRSLPYERQFVYFNPGNTLCRYTFEWSVGAKGRNENRAAQTLLSWMLGNVYQTDLMMKYATSWIPEIPVNEKCLEERISSSRDLKPIWDIREQLVFRNYMTIREGK